MFSHASVILFTIVLMDNRSLLLLVGNSVTPCYGAGGAHPIGMLRRGSGQFNGANLKLCHLFFM